MQQLLLRTIACIDGLPWAIVVEWRQRQSLAEENKKLRTWPQQPTENHSDLTTKNQRKITPIAACNNVSSEQLLASMASFGRSSSNGDSGNRWWKKTKNSEQWPQQPTENHSDLATKKQRKITPIAACNNVSSEQLLASMASFGRSSSNGDSGNRWWKKTKNSEHGLNNQRKITPISPQKNQRKITPHRWPPFGDRRQMETAAIR